MPTATDSAQPFAPNGVRVERLRSGTDETLFVVPGLDGDVDELSEMVDALRGPQQVYALAPLSHDAAGVPITSIERMAELMIEVVRSISPSGPYRLAGYSFGALIALEVGQQLQRAGDVVDALFLIEAVYDERFWPRQIWLRALCRRTHWQITRIAKLPPRAAAAEFRLRGTRLAQRVIRRSGEGHDRLNAVDPGVATQADIARQAVGAYRPVRYVGRMTLVASSHDRHFGCDTAVIWRRLAEHLEVQRIEGDHLTVMHDADSAIAVARVLDHGLATRREAWPGLRPMPGFERPMILTTMRWFSAARLAHALGEAGFAVSACRPRGHALELVDQLTSDAQLRRIGRARSVIAAIRAADADLILCDDERALTLLRRLHDRTVKSAPDVAAVIKRSLGHPEDWPAIASRTGVAAEARALNLAAPDTAVVASLADVEDWVDTHGLPVALKTDGSWGGRGVAIVRDRSRLPKVWQTISSPPGMTRALKRAVFDRDAESLMARVRHTRPVVNAQEFCSGREAIVTAACVDGKVEALVCLEVVQVSERRGPAAVVRIVDHPDMAETARQLIARFGLSGFCGFDFIITCDGAAKLVELNPRVTPTCHLLLEGRARPDQPIALFPSELVRDQSPGVGTLTVLDSPVRAPLLVIRGNQLAARHHRPITRMTRRLKQISSSNY